MIRILLLFAGLVVMAVGFACGGGQTYANDSPTEAYKRLYAAVKAKDIEAIKSHITKKTIGLGEMSAKQFNKPLDSAYENGFTATTFAASLPEIRDERVEGNMGAVEVYNAKDAKWEDLPFMIEDGVWKLAVGEMFDATYKSPGPGRDARERQAANALNPVPIGGGNSTTNMNTIPINKAPEMRRETKKK
jgi:hypothetical protein